MRQTPSSDRLQIEWDLHEFGPRPHRETEQRPARPAPAPQSTADRTPPRLAHLARLTEKAA